MADPRISILAFPQRIVGNELFFNVLIVPRNIDPLNSWPDTNAPAWVNADLQLRAMVISSLNKFPAESPSAVAHDLNQEGIPSSAGPILTHLQTRFNIVPAPPGSERRLQKPKPTDFARKYLPQSYRKAFHFTGPRTRDAVTDDSYYCAIKKNPKPNPAFTPSTSEVSWGEVFAYCLRQPALAEKVGFVHRLSMTVDAEIFEEGGWLYIDLVPGSSYTQPADLPFLKKYAARIPALVPGQDRNLFAPILFPVKASEADPDPIGFDLLYPEAATYDDGFAKIVHASQPVSTDVLKEADEADDNPPIHDIGIRLGWEDEQILIWMNRQLRADPNDPAMEKRLDSPMGVFQYRVDVKESGAADWSSLNLIRNKADLVLDAADPANTLLENAGNMRELGIDVYPSKLDAEAGSHYWLPAYFSNWIGKPLVLPDEDAAELYMTDAAGVQLAKIYEPAVEDATALTYGNEYQFRVRFADPTGGGPGYENTALNNPVYEGPAVEASCWFKRHVVPQPVDVLNVLPLKDEDYFTDPVLQVKRPRLGYPSVVFTGKYGNQVMDLLRADRDEAVQFEKDPVTNQVTRMSREFGLRDPDVAQVEIVVEVKALEMDTLQSISKTEAYSHLYTALRSFSADFDSTLDIPVSWVDAHELKFSGSPVLRDLGLLDADDGVSIQDIPELVLPRARDIRITLRAVCHNELNYFGGEKFRYGKVKTFFTRMESVNELDLFKDTSSTQRLRGIYLQPDTELLRDTKIMATNLLRDLRKIDTDLIQRIASATGLESIGFSLLARAGRRIQFGCSRTIRNSISPDGTSISFSTKADLVNQWIVPVQLILDRDWSWDALEPSGFEVYRKKWFRRQAKPDDFELVGNIEMKQIINIQALKNPDRSQTWLVFFDGVEPKPAKGEFPDVIELEYSIRPVFREGHGADQDPELELSLSLPVTTNPAQVPKLVSSGLALSKYSRDGRYSQSDPRARYLWLEFDEPVLDPNDALFVRVLGYAPDPLLSDWRWELFIVPSEPLLPIDPEEVRTITPAQPEDNSGLDAMQELTSVSPDGKHFIVPLPPGLHPDSPELFGFFTYEIRVGHKNIWSTAQGRFGRPLRTTGVQHPAPNLFGTVYRNEQRIAVSAPFARAVSNGKNVTARPPRTQIWCMLYAQVRQADGRDFRNILLDDRLLEMQPHEKIKLINDDAVVMAQGSWTNQQVSQLLSSLGLPRDAALSILCVEMLPVVFSLINRDYKRKAVTARKGADMEELIMGHLKARYSTTEISEKEVWENSDYTSAAAQYLKPLSDQLGNYRILRTSHLIPVPEICCVDCE